jgi:outer membrane protein TolC
VTNLFLEVSMNGFLSILLLAALPAVQTEAGPPPAPFVDELIAEALTRSPALAALRAGETAARERETSALALPDPMIEAMIQNADFPNYTIGTEDMSMAGFEVRQPLPHPGKRRALGEAARAETAVRAAERVEMERRIAYEVRSLYARLYALDQELLSLEAARELVDLLTATATTRYATGGAEQEDLLKAQLQAMRLEERLEDHHAEREALAAELNRWLDRPGDSPLGQITVLPPVAAVAARALVASSPRVRIAQAGIEAADRRLATARLNVKPDLSPAAGFAFRGPLGPVLTLRLGVELPFWKRQKQEPLIRAAEAELEQARQELRDAEAVARSETERWTVQWRTAERQIVRYREGILPQTSATLDATRSSYVAGRGSFFNVIDGFNLWLEARVQLARREADRRWSRPTTAPTSSPARSTLSGTSW